MSVVPIVAQGSRAIVTKLTQSENVTDVLEMWLSVLPITPGSVQKIIETLQGEISTISKRLDKANNKLDRLLESANLECTQHLKAAIVSFRNKKEEDGQASLTAALAAATRGFSLAEDVDGWVESTQLKLTCSLLQIHREDEEFALISLESKKWLAEMYELHIWCLRQKMHQKRGSLKADIKKSAFFMQGGKSKDVIRKLNEFDLQESKALHSVYGVMSEGCGWTNPKEDIPNSQGHIMFEVMPQYVPIGAKNAVCLLVLQEPKICVEVYRKHEYSYDKTKKNLVTKVTLFWSIDNRPPKVEPLDLAELSDFFRIFICVDKLDKSLVDRIKERNTMQPAVCSQPNTSTTNLSPYPTHSPTRPTSSFSSPQPVLESKSETLSTPSQGIHLPTCFICRQVLKGDKIEALGKSFHPGCFNCSQCDCNLAGDDDRFKADESKNIHCFSCYNRKFGKICFGCKDVIKVLGGLPSQMLKAGGRTYHPDCYRCESCFTKFGDGGMKCYPKNGQFLCSNCS